jgi:hypothetical protein
VNVEEGLKRAKLPFLEERLLEKEVEPQMH